MLKSLLKSITNGTLKLFGLKLVKDKPKRKKESAPAIKMRYVHDPAFSYMNNDLYQEMLYEELAGYAEIFFSNDIIGITDRFNLKDQISEFFNTYTKREHTDNTSGSGFHNAFWLFLFCRAMNPELIIESGVWKGHSTWLFEQASPDAHIFGFDKNLEHVEYQNLKAKLIELDWNHYDLPEFNPQKALVFFDCHVNHAKRIIEANKKGFKHLIFDDNPPVHKLYSHIPGIPTAHMVYSGVGLDSPKISWSWNNKKLTRNIDLEQAQRAQKLIHEHLYFPDVGGPTRYGGFTFLTYVQLK